MGIDAPAADPHVGYIVGSRPWRIKKGVVVVSAMLPTIIQFFIMQLWFPNDNDQTQAKDLSLIVGKHDANFLCNKTNEVAIAVRNHALLDEEEALNWKQSGPFHSLTCEQLIRSLPTLRNSNNDMWGRSLTGVTSGINVTAIGDGSEFELQNLISLQRLAAKLIKLEQHSHNLTVVVMGGSMTTGFVDGSRTGTRDLAFPRKLEQFMRHQWPASSLKVINIAQGGADENFWLGKLDHVMELDPDVILVESAVNDQCAYDKQDEKAEFVNSTSFSLLSLLINLPQQPAVISVELFRTAFGNANDANRHCRGQVQNTSDPRCYFCPQWWKPQTWRGNARKYNSVSQASYRDAVWPILHHPPDDLCSKYWNGLSHPDAGVHTMVASTIFFQFLVVMEKANVLLQLSKQANDAIVPKAINTPKGICLAHISSYHAMQDDPKDPFIDEEGTLSEGNATNSNYLDSYSCWNFRADVQRKYGWICEVNRNSTLIPVLPANAFRLSKKLRIGGDRKIIISRLISYDDRMATAQVWFTTSSDGLDSHTDNSNVNIFKGDPVWNISSWHKDRTSIPQPYVILLEELQFKDSLQIQWPLAEGGDGTNSGGSSFNNSSSNVGSISSSTIEVTFNLKILLGTSRDSISQVDKFKLLGIVTC
jgi:hypothetical protein